MNQINSDSSLLANTVISHKDLTIMLPSLVACLAVMLSNPPPKGRSVDATLALVLQLHGPLGAQIMEHLLRTPLSTLLGMSPKNLPDLTILGFMAVTPNLLECLSAQGLALQPSTK